MADTECPFCLKLSRLDELPPDEIVWQFLRSVAFLGPWQYYHGYCILVSRRHETELYRLEAAERHAYLDELSLLAQAIAACFEPVKINYELLGNQVPHLHWHLFPRYADDPDRLRPTWLALDRAERDEAERQRLMTGPLARAATAARLRQFLTQVTTR